jgi:hemoglobin/transferrin/lactoferrin receptor protein
VQVFSLNGDFEKVTGKNSQFFYGAEYVFNHVGSSAHQLNIATQEISELSTRYPEGGSIVHTMAIYSSFKRNFNDRLFFNAGLRFTHQDLESKFLREELPYSIIQNSSTAINGNIGLVYKPDEKWNVSGMLSSGFRAPNVDDISKVFDSEPGNVVVPNPGLKPEYSYNSEVTLARYIASKVKLSSTVFYSLLHNAMVRGDAQVNGKDSILYDGELSRVQAIINTRRAHIYGLSLSMQMEMTKHWTASMNLDFTQGRDQETDEPLRHTTPLFGSASIIYKQRKFQIEFYSRFNGKRSFDDLPPSEQNKPHLYSSDGSPAWYTINLRGKYQLNKFLSFNSAFENIFDHHYRTYSSGISAPGRNLVLSVKVNF